MLLTDIKAGRPIEIFINRQGYRYRLVSKIEEVGEDCIYISLIATRTKIFQFETTDKIDFVYRIDDRLWKWSGVRGTTGDLEGKTVHCLHTKKEGETYNRRNAFRVFMGIEVPMFLFTLKPDISEETLEKIKRGKRIVKEEDLYDIKKCTCLIKDLSENGIGFFANEAIDVKTNLSINIPSSFGTFHLKAEVIRAAEEHFKLYKNYYGCTITESEKGLTKFIFDLQRKQLYKRRSD